ncbi:MAG: hypothetical protein DRR16_29325 [Candidatus Parabeggiatoa sp. nov. 3]|nr:MAG: hypothetical protein DRR00_27895 [Gammaproteobacteria bacterium]RKZ77610.1 MAG: hypothetical protein DRR16_29325 [Gammaproteobacteria bacterium]
MGKRLVRLEESFEVNGDSDPTLRDIVSDLIMEIQGVHQYSNCAFFALVIITSNSLACSSLVICFASVVIFFMTTYHLMFKFFYKAKLLSTEP